jgi:hypothetical protein
MEKRRNKRKKEKIIQNENKIKLILNLFSLDLILVI